MSDPIETKIDDLISELHLLKTNRQQGRLFSKAMELKLLHGLARSQESSRFIDRLQVEPEQKYLIAEFVKNNLIEYELRRSDMNGATPTLFFESGSTTANLIGVMAEYFANETEGADEESSSGCMPLNIKTNNLFALTAFATLVKNVETTSGPLMAKYYAFLPFGDNQPKNEDEQRSDAMSHGNLQAAFRMCSAIIATCSNFSLLGGPLVGSRANALFKHALHTHRATSGRFLELFHFQKLIPSDAGNELTFSQLCKSAPPDHHKCMWVFCEPNRKRSDLLLSNKSIANHTSKYLKGELHNQTPVHGLGNWAQGETVSPIQGWQTPWIDRTGGTDIFIGLIPGSERQCAAFVAHEVEFANQKLKSAGCSQSYMIQNMTNAERNGVLHLQFS
ncbi:MAG: hypothetical protein FLDDKLPJ_03596 [Phycisphaerae bacterium]|nr:hypothetical protein [Phycisphaerae bacterium]